MLLTSLRLGMSYNSDKDSKRGHCASLPSSSGRWRLKVHLCWPERLLDSSTLVVVVVVVVVRVFLGL